jgi:segregation and condensation protein A
MRLLLGQMPSWSILQSYLPDVVSAEEIMEVRSAIASTFAATLELVKNGEMELRQDGTFAPIYLRKLEKTPDETVSEQ